MTGLAAGKKVRGELVSIEGNLEYLIKKEQKQGNVTAVVEKGWTLLG